MSQGQTGRHWLDRLDRKHEFYGYDEADSLAISVEHRGRSLQVMMPPWLPPARIKALAVEGSLLFLIAESVDQADEYGEILEGGDGLLIVAKALEASDPSDRFAVVVAHCLYPQALERFAFSGDDLGAIAPW